jgi:hypothetical protein
MRPKIRSAFRVKIKYNLIHNIFLFHTTFNRFPHSETRGRRFAGMEEVRKGYEDLGKHSSLTPFDYTYFYVVL